MSFNIYNQEGQRISNLDLDDEARIFWQIRMADPEKWIRPFPNNLSHCKSWKDVLEDSIQDASSEHMKEDQDIPWDIIVRYSFNNSSEPNQSIAYERLFLEWKKKGYKVIKINS